MTYRRKRRDTGCGNPGPRRPPAPVPDGSAGARHWSGAANWWRTRDARAALVGAVLGLAVGAIPVHAQAIGGSISGLVRAPSGAGVHAEVRAIHLATGTQYHSSARPDAEYRFPALPPGTYELRPVAEGLASPPAMVRVRVGTHAVVPLAMALSTETYSVTVTESTPLVEAATAALGTVVEREELRNLPLNQRVFLPLTLLAGGTHSSAPGSELSTQNDSGFHVAGARESSNNFLLDGIDNNDIYINRIVVSPPLDTVREFRLHASGYKAEFGRSAGGQVNVVSRSGSAEFHGSAYGYFRNENLDAKNFFDPEERPIPPYRRSQFGGTLGGPLAGDRTFFFGGFEGTRIDDAATRTASVPTPALRNGDFSGLESPVIDPFAGAPFPGNRIPESRQSSIGAAIAGYWPDPNRANPVQNHVSSPVGDSLVNQVLGRVDRYFGDSSRLFARYIVGHARSFDPFSGSEVPGFGSFTLDRGQQMATSFTHAFSPLTLLEARGGFNRLRREVLHQNAGNDIAGELGIPGLSTDPRFVGFPGVNVAGFASLSDDTALPILRHSTTSHISVSLTRPGARHGLKWGGELRAASIDGTQGLFGRGQFNFLGAISQHPVSDLLLGFPTYSIRTVVDNDFRQRARFWNGFVQDDWRLARRITLSAGMRYEYNAPVHDADDRFMQFDLDAQRLVVPGTTSLGRAGYAPDRNNFAPRIGVAWNPRESLVLRAAYGTYHEVNILEANSGLYFNPPYFDLQIYFPSQFSLPSLDDPFGGPGFTPTPSVNALQPDFRTGYAQQWNAGVERAVAGGVVVRASYVGSKGSKLLRRRNLNQPPPGAGEVDARRPIPGFANVVLFESAASSIYHSGVLTVERRFRGQLGFRAAYTWAKAIDDVSAFLGSTGDQAFPQDSHNFRAERGLSNFDQRHRLAASVQYAVPFRHWFARGWRAYAIATIAGGRPLTPQLVDDNSNTGNTGGIFGSDRPHLLSDPGAVRSAPGRYFDPGAFAVPSRFTFGNAGRNVLTGPGTSSIDAALVRSIQISDTATIEMRVEAFNLANAANFGLPGRTFGLPTFGQIPVAGQARQVQLGLRLTY